MANLLINVSPALAYFVAEFLLKMYASDKSSEIISKLVSGMRNAALGVSDATRAKVDEPNVTASISNPFRTFS